MTDRYIDPNSGAAPQPGGLVSPGSPVEENPAVVQDGDTERVQESDGVPDQATQDSDATEIGGQSAAGYDDDADQGDSADGKTETEEEAGQLTPQQGEPEAKGDSESEGSESASAGDAEAEDEAKDENVEEVEAKDAEAETVEKDYSELLAQNLGPIQKYMDENPDEVEAIKAAEAKGKNRGGVLNYGS